MAQNWFLRISGFCQIWFWSQKSLKNSFWRTRAQRWFFRFWQKFAKMGKKLRKIREFWNKFCGDWPISLVARSNSGIYCLNRAFVTGFSSWSRVSASKGPKIVKLRKISPGWSAIFLELRCPVRNLQNFWFPSRQNNWKIQAEKLWKIQPGACFTWQNAEILAKNTFLKICWKTRKICFLGC